MVSKAERSEMKGTGKRVPFPPIRFEADCEAPAGVVYGLLAHLRRHLEWAGERQSKGFRLLSMEAPSGPATVGVEFLSTGSDGKKRVNRDRSVITEASPPSVFEFVTENRCEGESGELASAGTFVHRYEISSRPQGCRVIYTLQTTRFEGGPAILGAPLIAPLLMKILAAMFRKGFRNLVALSEDRAAVSAAA